VPYEYVEPGGAVSAFERHIERLLNGDRERAGARAGTTSTTLWRGQITIRDRELAHDYSARPSAYRASGPEVREAHYAKCGGDKNHKCLRAISVQVPLGSSEM
jgi:hypothetical protein